jgi:3' terminal RNA ribose 2'-O-methyltransferase Hen1
VTLRRVGRVRDLLTHVYVLVPVLDDDKHYFVGDDEVDKLLRHGEGWLADHPMRALIAERYLKHQRSLADAALARLVGDAEDEDDASVDAHTDERPMRLDERRLGAVVGALKAAGARSVVDLGCGEGKLVRALLRDPSFERIVGVDVAQRSLARARERLRIDTMSERQRARVSLLHGSLLYRDTRLAGFDAAAIVEVIEHLDPVRLAAFERVVFAEARPRTIVLTTPNAEYNVHYPQLREGAHRHADHRFEWTRAELETWARRVADVHRYDVRFLGVGDDDAATGAPTQMAIFTRAARVEGADR